MSNDNTLINLEIEGLPPTVNHMHMKARGRVFRTKACKDFQDFVTLKLKSLWGNKEPFTGRVALEITFTTNNKRRWDLDNRLKALQDCLTMAGIIKDDSQIDKILLLRNYGSENKTVLRLLKFEDGRLSNYCRKI